MIINYAEIKRLDDARQIVDSNAGIYTRDDEDGIRISSDHSAKLFPSGLISIYTSTRNTTDSTNQVCVWPAGMGWSATTAPRKEYVSVRGHDNVLRHYLMPLHQWGPGKSQTSLLFQPHPELNYVPVTPIRDYHISISRKKKMDAMKKWQPFFDYVETMWDVVPSGVFGGSDDVKLDDKESWYRVVQGGRYSVSRGKAWVKAAVESAILRDDLPYNVKLVPVTETSHSAHWDWDLIAKLDKAGLLP